MEMTTTNHNLRHPGRGTHDPIFTPGTRVAYEDRANPLEAGTVEAVATSIMWLPAWERGVTTYRPSSLGVTHLIRWDDPDTAFGPGDGTSWSDCRQAGWKAVA